MASRLASKTSTTPPPLQCRPSPSALALPRRTAAAAMRWSFSPGPRKTCPTSNSATSLKRPARVALGGGDEAGNEARAHVGEVGGDRIGERKRRRAAAEQLRRGFRDERPGHRLAQRKRGERALGEPRALLHQRQHRLRARPRRAGAAGSSARGRRRRCAGSARRRRPSPERPGRHDGTTTVPSATPKPRRARIASPSSRGMSTPMQPLDLAIGESDRTPRRRRIARHDHPRRFAAAESSTNSVARSQPGTQKSGSTPRSNR